MASFFATCGCLRFLCEKRVDQLLQFGDGHSTFNRESLYNEMIMFSPYYWVDEFIPFYRVMTNRSYITPKARDSFVSKHEKKTLIPTVQRGIVMSSLHEKNSTSSWDISNLNIKDTLFVSRSIFNIPIVNLSLKLQVCPKKGINPYNPIVRMGLRPSIALDRERVWILRVKLILIGILLIRVFIGHIPF